MLSEPYNEDAESAAVSHPRRRMLMRDNMDESPLACGIDLDYEHDMQRQHCRLRVEVEKDISCTVDGC